MPTITEDTQLKQQFINALQERSAPIRTEIHVSDLIFCLRKAFYRRFKNRKLSEQQLIFFLDGHQRHEGLQALVPNLGKEVAVRKYGIVGHLDILNKHPIEIKTTHFKQLAYYCLLTDTTTCNLITQYINDGLLTFEHITFSKAELDKYLQEMLESRDLLRFAYERKTTAQLPIINDWICQKCEFNQLCMEATK